MKISNNRKLKELQTEFNSYFPFLRIEFYKTPYRFGTPLDDKDQLNPELRISDVCPLKTFGFMPIKGHQKVGDFEQQFFDTFGISVQVFRKSYDKWLQTWATDIWTLEEQNNRGKIMGHKQA